MYFEVQLVFFPFLSVLRLFFLFFLVVAFFGFFAGDSLASASCLAAAFIFGVFLAFVLRVMPPLSLEVMCSITVVRIFYLEYGV